MNRKRRGCIDKMMEGCACVCMSTHVHLIGSGDDALEKANRECIELIISGGKGLVLLVGAPASGKSTVGKAHFEPRGYTRINMVCKGGR